MLRFSSSLLRAAGLLALALYFLAAVAFLGLRYWVLPNIDQWRPYLQQELSLALGARVTMGVVRAEWRGLNPSLELSDVVLSDDRKRPVLSLPHLRVTPSWRSVLGFGPQFVRLEATGVDLRVRRDHNGRLWVLGRSFEPDTEGPPAIDADNAAIRWLAIQRRILLHDATIRWIDESRDAAPLVLQGVALQIDNKGRDHRFSLRAIPPPSLGRAVDMRGHFQQPESAEAGDFAVSTGRGELYIRIEQLRTKGIKPWFDVPQNLESGRVSAQALLTLDRGVIQNFTSDVKVEHGRWRVGDDARVYADSAQVYLNGPWNSFKRVFTPDVQQQAAADEAPIDVRLIGQGAVVQIPDMFEHTLQLTRVGGQGGLQRIAGAGLRVRADQLHVLSSDLDASFQGSWEQGGDGPAGVAAITGRVRRALIASIDDHLPRHIDEEVREWMAHGLLDGVITDGDVALNGDLHYFPFSEHPEKGDFRLSGQYVGGIVDYLPHSPGSLGWPGLTGMEGSVVLRRADLDLLAERAVISPTPETPIQLRNVVAHIARMDHDPLLTIVGETTAEASHYLALMKHSALGGLLGGVFNEASADGVWDVPLKLNIPLAHARQTTVEGAIHFAGGALRLAPEMPPFTQVDGVLDFSDDRVGATGLKAMFLGGPVALSGRMGTDEKGLLLQGRVGAKALGDYVGLQGMRRLEGGANYKATVQHVKGKAVDVVVNSDLVGLAVDVPPPLRKTADQSMPFRARWSGAGRAGNHVLDATLGTQLMLRLNHADTAKAGSYFYSGALGVNKEAEAPANGMSIDLQYRDVDADAWNKVVGEFSRPLPKAAPRAGAMLPELATLRLQADTMRYRGLVLDQLTYTARRPASNQWRVDISSSETAGTLFWREAKGRVAGQIDANFDRLALGSEKSDPTQEHEESDFNFDEDLDIPAINLHVKKLRLYGRDVGELSLSGVNQERGRLWRLDRVKLTGAGATLNGTGSWRLNGPQRGLAVSAKADVSSLGDYFDQIGWKGIMIGGHGAVEGELRWGNLPWSLNKADISGKVVIQLEKGRFNNLNSRSARLLELLSLQSVSRLARLDFNPRNLMKEGFPYDNLRGTLSIDKGALRTDDYRVIGPVGTIVLGGETNLLNEQLNLQAVVIPNLDVSGAAIAAGIAVNPIVGIGAFLTQWLLRVPLAKAMTAQYQIKGTWDAPKITEAATLTDSMKTQLDGKSASASPAENTRDAGKLAVPGG